MTTPVLLPLSGTDPDALRVRLRTVLASLDDPGNQQAELTDLAARLAVVTPGPLRLGLVATDRPTLRASLTDLLQRLPALADDPAGRWFAGIAAGQAPRVALVFPGQGAQRVGEHRELAALSPRFAARCRELLAGAGVPGLEPLLTSGWRGHPLDPAANAEAIRRTDAAQTLLTVLGVSVAELLTDLGVPIDVTLGHSVGEFAALHAAGMLTAADAVRLAARRGVVMRDQLGADGFGMVAVRAGADEVAELAEPIDQLFPCCYNSRSQTVFGGTAAAVDAFLAGCRAAGVAATPIPTQGAFHTPLMAASATAFAPATADVPWGTPHAAFISTVSGAPETDPQRQRALLAEQITAPVAFRQAAERLVAEQPDIVIQVTGGHSLLDMIRTDHPDAGFLGIGLGGAREDSESTLRLLGRLFVRTPDVHLAGVLAGSGVAAHWRLRDVRWERDTVFRLDAVAPAAPVVAAAPVAAAERVVAAAAPASAPASTAPGLDELRIAVLGAMAQASGSPLDELARGGRLAEDLGFDSLLMTDTLRRLTASYPLLVPAELHLAGVRDVDGLVATLADALGCGTTGEPAARPAEIGEAVETLPANCQRSLQELPELAAFDVRQEQFRGSGTLIPYYLPHDGTISSHTEIQGRRLVSFSSYNYLGLSEDPRVQQAVIEAVQRYGTSASAARILSGHRPVHDELERAVAGFVGAEDAVVLVGGHATNASIVPLLIDEADIVFHDALAHDSIQQGVKASGAVRHSFPHNDLDALESALRRRRPSHRRALICVEGAYSMDGDTAPLRELVELKERYGAILMVDEAHSFGTVGGTGRGVCEATGVDPARVDVLMGTLSKSMASCGGYLAGSHRFIEYLRYNLSSLVFSAALSPANTAAALESLRVLRAEPERVQRLQRNADRLRTRLGELGLDCGDGAGTPIVPVIFGDSERTLAVANHLYRAGYSINPILAPAVAERLARLRIFVTAAHTDADLDGAVTALAEATDRVLVDVR